MGFDFGLTDKHMLDILNRIVDLIAYDNENGRPMLARSERETIDALEDLASEIINYASQHK